jgi:hypothetical protein
MLLDALAIETAAVPPQDGQGELDEDDDDEKEGVNTALNNSVARAL